MAKAPQPEPTAPALPGFEEPNPSTVEPPEPPPHYAGHRDRLRRRFLTGGTESLQDYELLEMLLFSVIPQRDTKPLAKDLIREFGDLWGVVTASPERLRSGFNFSDARIAAITVVGAAALRATRQQVKSRPVLESWDVLVHYCQAAMARETTEQLRLLFLDRKNGLISDEVHQHGTIDHLPTYPREVVKRALELGAYSIVLVHNHPSGDPTPSRDDIHQTRAIKAAAEALGMILHDHLIIGRGKTSSFKTLGLL
ncbi:MAG: DNA repair protein RadC [Rhodospirillaceae bacterium]